MMNNIYFKIPKIIIPWTWNFVIALLLLTLICGVVHELGHHVVNMALGEDSYMSFSAAGIPKDPSTPQALPLHDMLLGLAGGMLITYFLSYLGLFLMLFSRRFQLVGLLLVFVNTIHRLPKPAAFDEEKFLLILSLDPNLIYFTLVPLMLFPLIIAILLIANKRKFLTAVGIIILILVFYGLRVQADFIFFLDPFMETGQLFPAVFGINVYVIILTLFALALFSGKYIRCLLPNKEKVKK